MSRLEGAYEQMSARMDSMDARMASMDARLNSMDAHILALDGKIDRKFNLLVSLIAGSWATLFIAVLVHR